MGEPGKPPIRARLREMFAEPEEAGVSVRGWLRGEPCLYESADECPDIDCSHNVAPTDGTGEGR